MPDKEFNKNMSNRFEGFGSTPSKSVWTGIEAHLIKSERKRRFIIWWFSGILALGLVSSLFFFPKKKNNTSTNQLTSNKEIENTSTSSNLEHNSLNSSSSKETFIKNNSPIENRKKNYDPLKSNIVSNNIENGNNDLLTYSLKHRSKFKPSSFDKTLSRIKSTSIGTNNDVILATQKNLDKEKVTKNINSLDLLIIETGKPSPPIRTAYFNDKKNTRKLWKLGLRVSQFITISPRIPENPTLGSPDTLEPSPLSVAESQSFPSYSDYINKRSFEAEVFIQRQFFHRLNISSGISVAHMYRSYSINNNSGSNFDGLQASGSFYSGNKSYWSIGIPVRADVYFINTNHFQFGGGIAFLTEYSSIKHLTQGATNMLIGQENTISKQHSLQLSLQPYFRANYLTSSRWNMFFEMGYRKNIFDSSELTKYTLPSYITFTGGISWQL